MKRKEEMQVKGSLFKDYQALINLTPKLLWDTHLSTDALKLLQDVIYPVLLYPFSLYQEIALKVFEISANKDLNIVLEWGKAKGREFFEEPGTKNLFSSCKTPVEALLKFMLIREKIYGSQMFDMTMEVVDEGHVIIKASSIRKDDGTPEDGAEPFTIQTIGNLIALIEMNGGNGVGYELLSKEWDYRRGQDIPKTIIELKWNNRKEAE